MLTTDEQAALDTYKSEVSTFAVQRLLGTKSFVKKLITTEPTTAEKLIGKIRELAAGLKNKKSPDAKAQAELLKTLNLNEAVSEQTPPAFIWTTAKDTGVPPDNAIRYAMALDKQGIDYELHVYPRQEHGASTADLEINYVANAEAANQYKRINRWLHDCAEFFRLYTEERF